MDNSKNYTSVLMGASCSLALVFALPLTASAQDQSSGEDSSRRLESVVVTANKRAQDINDVGLSIAAVSGNVLEDRQLSDLSDIATLVPGLVVTPSTTNTPIITLRGVGFNESSLGVYPATSIYIDEAPLPFPAMSAHTAYDLERVEVLKGPQGVLFGQNATGGAVNFIAKRPTDEFEAGADFSFGSFSRLEANGYISGPLADGLNARLAVQSVRADEWQQSESRPGDENGKEDYFAGRFLLDYELNESARLSFNLNGWQDKSDPQAQQFIAARPKRPDAAPGVAAVIGAVPFSREEARAADWSPETEPESDRSMWQGVVRGDFDLTDVLTLTAQVSRVEFEQDQVTDGDGLALLTADLDQGIGELNSTIAEVRIANDGGSRARWVLGANYESSDTYENTLLLVLDNTSYRPDTFYLNSSGAQQAQDIETYAVFGNVDFDITGRLKAKIGARYTDTTIDANSCNYAPPNHPDAIDNGNGNNEADLFNFLGAAFGTVPFDPIGGFPDCFSLNNDGVPGEEFIDTLAEDNVSWRAGLDYDLGNTLLYANVSKGFKAGSYPTLTASSWVQLEPVVQESVMAYEAGFKSALFDGRVQWNGAAFYYDYKDKQVKGKINAFPFGPLDNLVNVDESRIVGVETDIVARLTDGLTLSAGITYLDSEVEEYSGFNVYGEVLDFSGNPIPFTPELTYSIDLDYRRTLSSGGDVFAGLNLTGQSESDSVLGAGFLELSDNDIMNGFAKSITRNYFLIDGFATLDARIGYESQDNGWRVLLWGKNITDEYYYTTVIPGSESAARFAGKPATYGVMVGFDF